MSATTSPTLAAALLPESTLGLALDGLLVLAGSLLLWLSAKVQVPFWPVPMTMQTFVVVMLAAAFGPRLGAAMVALYLAKGALGLPVFAGAPEKGAGPAYMTGPTGGYLAGFLVAAIVVGMLAERGIDRTIPGMLVAALLGHAVILLLGWAWLARRLGAAKAWSAGVAPFWAATAAKTLLAALVLPAAWQLVER